MHTYINAIFIYNNYIVRILSCMHIGIYVYVYMHQNHYYPGEYNYIEEKIIQYRAHVKVQCASYIVTQSYLTIYKQLT